MRLIEALRYKGPTSIAFVGAGGKTTALFRTACEIIDPANGQHSARSVLVTTSTHLGMWQAKLADRSVVAITLQDIQKLREPLQAGIVLVTGVEEKGLLSGLSGVMLAELQKISEEQGVSLLIEADGAHSHPLKAPAEHEPAIPDFVQHVVVVAGMMGLGKPLSSDWVHRPEIFANLSGFKFGELISDEAVIKLLRNKDGGLKAIPTTARRSALLNQADDADAQSHAARISKCLLPAFQASIVASLTPYGKASQLDCDLAREDEVQAVIEPIAGIILAAGASRRFGEPKQLLQWKGMSLLKHVAMSAIKAGLSPIVIVVGNSASEVRQSIIDLPVIIVDNPEWVHGMSSSIKVGLGALPDYVGGAVFLHSDQPQIPFSLIQKLIEAHDSTLHPIIAPLVDGRRANPVLFDAGTFPDLLELSGEIGGRALFAHHPVDWVTWHDHNILLDIDTPEDYTKFLQLYHQNETPG